MQPIHTGEDITTLVGVNMRQYAKYTQNNDLQDKFTRVNFFKF